MAKAAHLSKDKEAKFKWDDALLLDDQLTEDERMIRDTARAYAQDKLLPRVSNAYLERTDRPRNLQRDGRAWPDRRDAA
jgi:glutaryl-CoA dehydrogenase